MTGHIFRYSGLTRNALFTVALLVALSGCKAGQNGVSTFGPLPKDQGDRSISKLAGAPLTVPAFLSLIGAKDSPQLESLPPSVRVLLASQLVIGQAANSNAPAVPPTEAAAAAPPSMWDGKSRHGVAEGGTVAAVPGWIWEPPGAPEVAPDAAPANPKPPYSKPAELKSDFKIAAEKPPVTTSPIEPPPVEQAPVELVRPAEALPAAQQPEARAQLASVAVDTVQTPELKRDELLLIAFLVVLAVILATVYALMRHRTEHLAEAGHGWRRLR